MDQIQNDFDFQLNYVSKQVPRLMAMQDIDAASPTFGCFHYGYWRDKTSEFPDGRFQEAGATLGLLSHPDIFPNLNIECTAEELRQRFYFSLLSWSKQQHPDGSFDEWYKHEHGFAVTAFSLIANGLCVHFLGELLDSKARTLFEKVSKKAADWLLEHDDLVKTNHEMAGAAALAIAGSTLNEPKYLRGAQLKHERALACQTDEGWFNEISGADLGYCFVLLDYAMLYQYFTKDRSGTEPMRKLLQFIAPFVQPDLTIPAEAGLCLNPYVSRVGTILSAEFSLEAQALLRALLKNSAGMAGITPYLSDDLRLSRWSHLAVIAKILLKPKLEHLVHLPTTQEVFPNGLIVKGQANIISYRYPETLAVFLPAGGGGIRITQSNWAYEDFGYIYRSSIGALTMVGYDQSRKVDQNGDSTFVMNIAFSPAKYFFPGFFSRLVLRSLGAIPGASKWLRMGIDFYRKKMKTAINQSAAPIAAKHSLLSLRREVKFEKDEVAICDELTASSELGFQIDLLEPQLKIGGFRRGSSDFPKALDIRNLRLVVRKRIHGLSLVPQFELCVESSEQ